MYRLLLAIILLITISAFIPATAQQLSGEMEMTLTREGAEWKGEVKFKMGDQESKRPAHDVKVNGTEFSLITELMGSETRLKGKLDQGKLVGDLEVFEKGTKVGAGVWTLTRQGDTAAAVDLAGKWTGTFQAAAIEQQQADAEFDTSVAQPAYTNKHPRVLFDEAHNNFHTTTGRYKPFATLVTNDGYEVTPNKQPFSADTLKGYDILVISNALGPRGHRDAAAFTDAECDAVRDWVRAGGALLFIADHAPMGGAAEILARRFDVEMSKAYTLDKAHSDPATNEPSQLLYTRENKLLADHPITQGRVGAERINRVIAFTGQSLKGPAGSVAFLKLADTAVDVMPSDKKEVPARGRSQGLAMNFGKGRVVVLGEAAMMTAQVANGTDRFGMNYPGTDDRQLALNIMHWLSRLLK